MGRSVCLTIILILCFLRPIASVEDKCGACRAVAAELESALANEKPKNRLDMRHRLDSRGQREGKVIDYKMSELRVVELLDGLCERMKDYTLDKVTSSKGNWIKIEDWESAVLSIEKQEAKAHSKDMSTFCGRQLCANYKVQLLSVLKGLDLELKYNGLLEKTEEELAEKIKSGTMSVDGVEDVLCRDLTRNCDPVKYNNMHKPKNSVDLSIDDGEL